MFTRMASISPGTEKGTITLRITCHRPAPSV